MSDAIAGHLASRASRAIKPALSYFKAFIEAKDRQWSPEDPEGNIILSVAENKISASLVHERLVRAKPCPLDALCYQDMRGLPRLREALARLLERTFMQGIRVDANQLCCSAGCGAIIESLFHCICGPRDAVLIPAPYYPAFDNDLEVKCEVKPWPFYLDEAMPIGQQLSAAAAAAEAAGHRVGALLITTPNNPLGTMYSRETIVAMLQWCLQRTVHLVSDEIYGNSAWGEGATFTSVEVIARQEAAALAGADSLPLLLHVVWGMSKDFCASGLRCGSLHSRNPHLLKALENISYFNAVSLHTQWALIDVLEDVEWLGGYLEENLARMRRAYRLLEGALDRHGIPHVRADSAMFCWVDLRDMLPAGLDGSWEGEDALWDELTRSAGVLLTPGQQCHGPAPGYFRVCWAWVPPEALPVAVDRIAALRDAKRGAGPGAGCIGADGAGGSAGVAGSAIGGEV